MYEPLVTIAESSPNETSALRELFLRARQETFNLASSTTFNLLDFDKYTQGEYILIAVNNGITVGFVSLWLEESFIHHLYIDTRYHGKGIGTSLLKAVIVKTGLPVRLKCLKSNEKAAEFYRIKGFVVKENGVAEGENYCLLELTKPLL